MANKWKILILVAAAVLFVDQWTKYLAVEQLTPAIAQPQVGGALSAAERERLLEARSFSDKLGAFWSTQHPCRTPLARCPPVDFMPGWSWRYVENPGAAWGFLAGASESVRVPFFLGISLAALVFIVVFLRKMSDTQRLTALALSSIFGGAIGNFVDRIHLNYVIDFIDWHVGTSHWPTFNVADAAISTGVGLLMLEWLLDAKKARKNKES